MTCILGECLFNHLRQLGLVDVATGEVRLEVVPEGDDLELSELGHLDQLVVLLAGELRAPRPRHVGLVLTRDDHGHAAHLHVSTRAGHTWPAHCDLCY